MTFGNRNNHFISHPFIKKEYLEGICMFFH
jgi:hypothetical protein